MNRYAELAPVREIALAWAATGHPVFPLLVGQKEPDGRLVPTGKDEATTDPEQIRAWWAASPRANVGIRCDGWLVIDVDGSEGEESFALLRDTFELPATLAFPTPRGRRLAYGLADGFNLGNGTTRIGSPPGIHIRAGTKGYIVAPGSVHPSGQVYAPDDGAPIASAPDALIRALEPPPRRPLTPRVPLKVATGDGTPYGLAALDNETRELATTPHGGRHDRLYLAAARLGELEAGGSFALG